MPVVRNLLWNRPRKMRRCDRSSSVELLWSRLRKMRGWLRSKIEKGIDQLPLEWPASCPTVFWSPCPYKRKKLSLLKSLPQEISLTRSAKGENWNPGPASNFSLQNLPSWRRKKSAPTFLPSKKKWLKFLPWKFPENLPKGNNMRTKCDVWCQFFF